MLTEGWRFRRSIFHVAEGRKINPPGSTTKNWQRIFSLLKRTERAYFAEMATKAESDINESSIFISLIKRELRFAATGLSGLES